MNTNNSKIRRRLRFFIVVLFLSGLSVLPVQFELNAGLALLPANSVVSVWLIKILDGYTAVSAHQKYLLYGYDWLAFAHFVLAILFIGPYKDPVRNIWVIEFGLIASALIIPFAMIAGAVRGIPYWWRLVDCSFGVFGFILLWTCYRLIKDLHHSTTSKNLTLNQIV
jgi:hypothetical protein